MLVSNVKFHEGINWDQYKVLPGISFSWLKTEGQPIPESEGMHIGKLVHTYLLKPKEYNFEHAEIVIPIASKLISFGGESFRLMKPELGITATFCVEGLYFNWRGMPDNHIFRQIVVDYKIIAGDLKGYVDKFKYDEQLRGYMLPVEAPIGLIIAYNKKTKNIQTHSIGQDVRWWSYKVKQYGKPS